MKCALLVLLVAVLAVAQVADEIVDPCLYYANQPAIVNAALAKDLEDYDRSDLEDLEALINDLLSIAAADYSNDLSRLFVGFDNDDLIAVISCLNPVNAANSACGSNRFIVLVINDELLDSQNLPSYYAAGDGTVPFTFPLDLVPVSVGTVPLRPTQRQWYVKEAGWTEPYLNYAVGVAFTSVTYVTPTSDNSGVIGADRPGTAPCGFCLESQDAVVVARLLSNDLNLESFSELTTIADVKSAAEFIQSKFLSWKPTDVADIFIGYANGDFYGVFDCKEARQDRVEECKDQTWLFDVVNVEVFGDNKIRTFGLSKDGKVGNIVTVSTPFDTVNRPWYLVRNGWAGIYSFTTGAAGRTYAASFTGGVVGVDTIAGVCPLETEEEEPTTTTSSSSSSNKPKGGHKNASKRGSKSSSSSSDDKFAARLFNGEKAVAEAEKTSSFGVAAVAVAAVAIVAIIAVIIIKRRKNSLYPPLL